MRFTILTEDDDGESHFVDADLELHERTYTPPAPAMYVSDAVPAARGVFFEIPAGWFGDWHRAPYRQYYVQTTGELEVQVGDGEIRYFHPGDVVLVEDRRGRGHTTRVVSDEAVCGVYVQLPDSGPRG
jgi:quercetin dioxygenase-like cupin family protein